VRRELPGGFELDDDRERVDLGELHRFLSTEAYRALGRPRETVEQLVREASRVVGLYFDARLVGFARTVSDGVSFAYLADVYVLASAPRTRDGARSEGVPLPRSRDAARAAQGSAERRTIEIPHALPEAKRASGSTSPSQPMKCFEGSAGVEP